MSDKWKRRLRKLNPFRSSNPYRIGDHILSVQTVPQVTNLNQAAVDNSPIDIWTAHALLETEVFYVSYKQKTDEDAAFALLLNLYIEFVANKNNELWPDNFFKFEEHAQRYFMLEERKVDQIKPVIDNHFRAADAGLLRPLLCIPRLHESRDTQIGVPVDASFLVMRWIIGASSSWNRDMTSIFTGPEQLALRATIQEIVDHRLSVTSFETLERLNNAADDPRPIRFARLTADRSIPSPPTGQYLQKYTLRKADSVVLGIPRGSVVWYDFAVFMMMSLLISHGFTEGNGRTCRAIFGAILMQNDLDLYFPDVAFEKPFFVDFH